MNEAERTKIFMLKENIKDVNDMNLQSGDKSNMNYINYVNLGGEKKRR